MALPLSGALAAALATLQELEARDAIPRMKVIGESFMNGIKKQAEEQGLQVTISGLPIYFLPGDCLRPPHLALPDILR